MKLSDDLKYATVFVSLIGDEARKKEALKGLKSGSHFMRGELGHRLRLRTAPELSFKLDESIEKGAKTLDILRSLDIKDDKGDIE